MPNELALLRLFQLTSANLPVGGFTYSQGLEWAVEAGWIKSVADSEAWLTMQMQSSLAYGDLPLLERLYQSAVNGEALSFDFWARKVIRLRETAESRQEERQRGQAFYRFMCGLGIKCDWDESLKLTQLAGLAWYAAQHNLPLTALQSSWSYSWLEGAVMAAMKLVPLGQQSGQQLIYQLSATLPVLITQASQLNDNDIGASSPIQAIASSCHETQYSRLFRS